MTFGSHSAHSSPQHVTGASSGPVRIRFDVFEADLRTGELFRQGKRVALPNQSFLALAALLEQPGQVVSRDELRARLWPDARVVEFDQGLNASMNRLREALGDSAGQPRFVETLPRRGYRFIGTVHPDPVPPGTGAAADARAVPVRMYGLAVLLAILIVSVTLVRWQSEHEADLFANPRIQRLTSSVGREVAPSFAADGRSFVYGWNGGADSEGRFDLYIKRIDSEHLLRLTHSPAIAISPAWAPGGGEVAFARVTADESGIYSIAATGGTERLLTPASFLYESFMQLSWSPDGRSLAYSAIGSGASSFIHVLRLDSLSKRVLPRPPRCADAGTPAFSPDGRQLAFVCTSSLAVYSVYVTDSSAANPRLLGSLQGNPRGLAWSTDGRGLILANDSADGSALWLLTLRGALSRLPLSEEALGPGLAATPQGSAFVRERQRVELWRVDLTSAADSGGALVDASSSQLVPEYSPDGARVVFQSGRSGSPEIWLADSDGHNPRQLTAFKGPLTGGPGWCSDGRRIAFDSRVSGTSAIYVMDVPDGPSHPLATSQSNLSLPVWSQDCRWIFASDGRATLYRVPASGGAAEQFTHKRTYRAAVSGDRVTFNVATPQGIELWSRAAAGGSEQPLEGMPHLRYSDGWCAARSGIYYTSAESQITTVNFYDFASHRSKVVRPLTGTPAALGGLGITVSPDERWLIYTRSADWQGDVILISFR